MPNNFTIKWSTTVDDIQDKDWIRIYGTDIIKSKQFIKANEEANFKDVTFYNLQVFKKDGEIAAIVPCFNYCIDILNITSTVLIKKWIVEMRKLFPSFLKLRTFITGSYACTCEHLIGYSSSLTDNEINEVSDIIEQELKKKCEETKAKFIFIKDIREHYLQDVKRVLKTDFRFLETYPTTLIPVMDVPYPNALKKKHRKRYRKYKELFDKRFYWTIYDDFTGKTAEEFYELYFAVVTKAKNKFEFLNAEFFNKLSEFMGDRAFLFVAKDKETDETRVMELVLINEEKLIPLYLGIKYKDDDTKVLYLNTIFNTVKEAEKRKKSFIDLGQTSYYPKAMSGALIEKIHYGFWAKGGIMKFMINHFFDKLFAPQLMPDHVYLTQYADSAHNILSNYNFVLVN